LNSNIVAILQCPHCKQELTTYSNGEFLCPRENLVFGWTNSGSLDLRPKHPISIDVNFNIALSSQLAQIHCGDNLPINPIPSVHFGDTPVPHHLSRELMSYFPKANRKDSIMLDLGCGDTIHRQVREQAGFSYVGLDYDNTRAPILGDAHVLPFQNESFEFLLSIAVLEHIQFPFVMIREANRVLKPGGIFIGTVAFLEPFHQNSFYHHSPLGTVNTLLYGGFEIVHIAANVNWSVFAAQAGMSTGTLFPRVPRWLSSNIILLPHRFWILFRRLARLIKPNSLSQAANYISGAFYFVAKKQ